MDRSDKGSWACGTLLVLHLAAVGCATIPRDRYGVDTLEIEGADSLDQQTLRACLATRERPHFAVNLGRTSEPECGQPPFDRARLHVRMWRWPWTEWPLYDKALFDRDLERIERWYRARGYYDARVTSTQLDPPAAATADQVEGEDEDAPCERVDDDEGCKVSITIEVEEGEPVLVESVKIQGGDQVDEALRQRLRAAMLLEVGGRFDEALYDDTKRALTRELREASYACATVAGRADVDPEAREAHVELAVEPGPKAVFGELRVEGNEDLPIDPILGAAYISPGDPYSESALREAQRAIYALGAFSSVQLEAEVSPDQCSSVVDVRVEVTPGRRFRTGLGVGLQAGTISRGIEQIDVPQWDVHALGVIEHRNLLGGMRRLRIEERPRYVFNEQFPRPGDSRQFGNLVTLDFRQPAFLEPRTSLLLGARYDWGPEPFGGRFTRHDLDANIAVERTFLDGRVLLSGGLHGNLFRIVEVQSNTFPPTSDYHLLFWEQYAHLDLRDDARQPSEGLFFGIGLHEAGFGLPASWDYVRTTPEVRGYVPLPLGLVLAARFGLGAIFVVDADDDLDEVSQDLGPERYRLRGGGASSNRGFLPGQLGDGLQGGRRRWEGTIELRIGVTEDFGVVAFGDLGDVSRGSTFRFDQSHPAVGVGLRYALPVINLPLRFDMAGLLPFGGNEEDKRSFVNLGLAQFPGAWHLTIGESF